MSHASFHSTAGSIQAQSYELAPRTRSTTRINITFTIPFVLTLFMLFLSHYRHNLKSPACKRELAPHFERSSWSYLCFKFVLYTLTFRPRRSGVGCGHRYDREWRSSESTAPEYPRTCIARGDPDLEASKLGVLNSRNSLCFRRARGRAQKESRTPQNRRG